MRKGCHLCEEAKELLEELQENWYFDIFEVDIDQDDALTELYGISIPVVALEGKEIQSGIINKNFIIEAFSAKNVEFIG